MARNRIAPPPTKKAAAPAPAPTPVAAKPAAAPAPVHQQPAATHMPPQQQHAAPPMMQSSGPGLMGTMAASMAGSVAGHAISNAMFGNSHSNSAAPAPAAQQPQAIPNDPCKIQFDMYTKCWENTTECQWVWEEVAKCRTSHSL